MFATSAMAPEKTLFYNRARGPHQAAAWSSQVQGRHTLNARPLVSIGIPVYQGEDFLEQALDSILGQTCRHFEVVLSDNASTDRTPEICEAYAAKDPRIRYYGSEKNRGASWNFNRVFELCKGDYFKWVAHDDVLAEDYVEKCVEVLDRDSSVVLVYPRTQDIDENGHVLCQKTSDNLDVSSPDAPTRFRVLTRRDRPCEPIFGLIRSDVLRKTRLLEPYSDSDRVLLAELGMQGRFHEIPEYLFGHREHRGRSVRQYGCRQTRSGWFNPSQAGRPNFPFAQEFWGFIDVIRKAPLGFQEKAACLGHMARWIVDHRKGLVSDVDFAGRFVLRPIKHRFRPPRAG